VFFLLRMFRSVYSVSFCCSVYCLCVNVYCTAATGISGHFSTTLLRFFRAFSSVARQMPGYNSQRLGTARTSQIFSFYCYVRVCISLYSVYCLCVNVYCTAATGISGHFSTTLLRFFRAFSSVVRQMPGYNSQRLGTARTSQFFFFLLLCTCVHFSVFCVLSVCNCVLYCTVLYCTVLYCTVPYCTVLYCTVLYCTVLYCTVLYCTYCTVLLPPGVNPIAVKNKQTVWNVSERKETHTGC
jgi:hypothetical protein